MACRACVRTVHHARTSAAPPPSDNLLRAFTRSLSHAQARGVAVSGSYAYVAAYLSNALVVVDVSNPASPVIRGSVVSSSLLTGVRAIQFCDRSLWRGWRRAPRLRRHLPSYSHPQRHRLLMPSRAFTRSLSRAVHAGYRRRRERLVCIRGGACILLAGCGRHEQPCVSSHPGQRGLVVSSSWGARDPILRPRTATGAAACVRPAHRARARGGATAC